MSTFPAGTAPVKAEFLVPTTDGTPSIQPVADDDAAEGGTAHTSARSGGGGEGGNDGSRSGGPSRKKKSREEKKARQGQNKNRKFGKVKDDYDLCRKTANGQVCEFGEECRHSHDIPAYLEAKPADLRFPTVAEVLDAPKTSGETEPTSGPIICPVFEEFGECKYGFKCRYLSAHVRKDDSGNLTLVVDEDKRANAALNANEANYITPDVQKLLRTKKYPTPIYDAYTKEMQEAEKAERERERIRKEQKEATNGDATTVIPEPEQPAESDEKTDAMDTAEDTIKKQTGESASALEAQKDTPDVPTRFVEKKRLNWKEKTYLAPLTTVGNLPFRRLCVSYGAEITCGEMGLATSFLQGSKEEWSLVRRHPSEKIFGVQVAGNKPNTLVPTAEVIAKEFGTGVDFVDVNCGCPIDLVFKTGSGSALLDAPGKLGRILVGMNKALGEIPVTVKLRTGVKDGKNNAHKLMPRLTAEWGASCLTLHGRTRQQRYTKLADWDYIKQCVDAVRAREAEEDLPPIPIFGGGDCFSSQDFWEDIEKTGVDGVMVGRGALIKPWIFTEIREKREWDISSRERLEGIRKLAEFGLCHFGTDTSGINTARRYLCEALSFQYRYVPIGLLERLPGKINDRAPSFKGRDELETLLASPDSRDWVKISEMFLGPAPEAFSFIPKHKSNAYESQG
ncbi:tRNA-dihydrouridine synthase 3 [Stygiomarasmius scandens]|uniref:tRNA-dihydrouridine(47) synthase [NAD(P)(+)] n=1 Tax=Marasmiellus scandens TaxID=2682957 RepID=A0ABR1IYC1_9AGAR